MNAPKPNPAHSGGVLRLLVWDLGRPGKARVQRILQHLIAQSYDLLVLAKCRSESLATVVSTLEAENYTTLLGGASFQPSLLVASKQPVKQTQEQPPKNYEHRYIAFQQQQVHALAVHVPYAAESEGLEGKRRYWQAVSNWAKKHERQKAIILGIFNTGLPTDTEGERFTLGESIQTLLNQGWVDCWKAKNPNVRDFGWFSHTGNGFRLDHCFFSPALAPDLEDAEFDHEARLARLSSSAPLVVTFSER